MENSFLNFSQLQLVYIFVLIVLFIIILTIVLVNRNKKIKIEIGTRDEILEKYKFIISVEDELERLTEAKDKIIEDISILRQDYQQKNISYDEVINIENAILFRNEERSKIVIRIDELKGNYKQKKTIYNLIVKEISILEEDLEDLSFGLYNPHFEYDSSEKYKEKMLEIKQKQKEAIRNKVAAKCDINWTVNDSKREGSKMTNRNIKLMLRAFNSECDSAVLKVKWNNVQTLEERIKKSFEIINKLGEPNFIVLDFDYLQLKIDELRITHEYTEKKHEEIEEQRRIRRQMREEQNVIKEIEEARREAEKEEIKYTQLLAKAKEEVHKKHGVELIRFNDRIRQLEVELSKVQVLKERAISRAQITKSGHVYIISNIGTFGENVYKIGMTRRLDPYDRVYELSGAAVPFPFDIHGLIYSEDAPKLENKLHKIFDKKRVNRVNTRKEFFNVTISELQDELRKIDEKVELTRIVEARQYKETLLLNDKETKFKIEEKLTLFPDEL